ncbi:antibiotic biosynthesis monooxygenase family protein [Halostreptopolyspora alba]|uniref:Antibiotic biosynthesis monooxygenase n=1 Tax=Halostreptopolyspora alba TaxID=2487137 RepID=A0A3N0EAE9_9ACTN|nr:antibiotic biosynthesis monooxygenase [Nocardiopsaceae bacterium YIM 96095]
MGDVVKFNVLTVPENDRATLEERFANRAGLVEGQPGFREFQLLRPIEGTDRYLVYTRWRSEADFQNWMRGAASHGGDSPQGAAGQENAGYGHGHGHGAPVATGAEQWGFEVVQHVRGGE